MSRRFFTETPLSGETFTLDGPEAHHLLHVMRCRPGDEIVVFDGSGDEADAEIISAMRREVTCRILQRRTVDCELPCVLDLAVALPKGDRARWLVEKLTELGVTRLTPLETRRGVVQPSDASAERLRRGVIEACKQCGRNRLLEIAEPQPLAEYVGRESADALRLLAHPPSTLPAGIDATSGSLTELAGAAITEGQAIRAIIGPEGGLTDDELELATRHGWKPISLGRRILRIETAAIAIASAVSLAVDR